MKDKKKKVGIQIDLNTYNNLMIESGKQYRTITSLVRKVLNEYLQNKDYVLIEKKDENQAMVISKKKL